MKNTIKTLVLIAVGVAIGRVSTKFIEIEYVSID